MRSMRSSSSRADQHARVWLRAHAPCAANAKTNIEKTVGKCFQLKLAMS